MIKERPLIEHKVIEIYGINPKIIRYYESLLPFIKEFSEKMNLDILNESYHNFKPHGTTMVFVLSNSHLAVHTWPEKKYIHIDLVTCAKILEDHKIIEILTSLFGIKKEKINIMEIKYGKD